MSIGPTDPEANVDCFVQEGTGRRGILAGRVYHGSYLRESAATREELPTKADSQGRNALFNGFPVCSIHNDKPMTVHFVLVVESARKNWQPNLVRGNDLRHEFVV